MTFSAFETATETGEPIELYEFCLNNVFSRFTSAQQDVTVDAVVYTAASISRGKLFSSKTAGDNTLEVTMPASNSFISRFASPVPGQEATLTLKRVHRTDTVDEEVVTLFHGIVRGIAFSENIREAQVSISALTNIQDRIMPRFTFQGNCNHMLYDSNCTIDKDSATFKKSLTVTSVSTSGKVLTVSGAGAFGSDFFVAGYAEFNDDFRMITAQGGTGDNDLTILLPFTESVVSQTVIFRAGCQHRLSEDCTTKFSNSDNFGGFAYVPLMNPFVTGLTPDQ